MMEFEDVVRNNVCANDTVSSDYEPSLNPFDKKFSYRDTDKITIPLNQIGRINQSQLFTVITSILYDKFESGYRYLFQNTSSSDPDAINYGAEHGKTCDKIIIQNRNLGKIKIADGLLTVLSFNHPSIKSSVICTRYFEQGEKACSECSISLSDNSDLDQGEVNFCPYTKYSNPDIQNSGFQDEIDDG